MAEPYLSTTWTDPVTGRHGYLVIDRLVGGLAGGGTRVREGCTLQEVERLAHAMTLKNGGLDPRGTRASIQGFGSMGGSTARYLTERGVRVVGIADAAGVIANPEGLDVEHYLRTRNHLGEIDRSRVKEGDRQLPRDAWLD